MADRELAASGQGADAALVEEKLKTAIEAGLHDEMIGSRADCNTLLYEGLADKNQELVSYGLPSIQQL